MKKTHRILFVILIWFTIGPAVLCLRAQSTDPAIMGQWSRLNPWPFYPVNLVLLPSGKVLFYSGDEGNSGNDTRLWTPATDTVTALAQPGYNTFCSGTALRSDGSLLVIGGHIANNVGLSNASLYSYGSNKWTRVSDMNAGRWYPTATALPNGDLLASSGYMTLETGIDPVCQVLRGSTWRSLTNAALVVSPYPWMFVAPNGKVFCAGCLKDTRYLDTTGAGAWSFVANSNWDTREYGSAVMYEPGKILILGGGGNVTEDPISPYYLPTATAEMIDLNSPVPAWSTIQPMNFRRRHPNATLLPDGKVLVTGGNAGHGHNNLDRVNAVHTAELWNPVTQAWSVLAASDPVFRRIYHSSALLLPDGRVITAGGNSELTPEIFSPPYLFKGARPVIASAPADVDYHSNYLVTTSGSQTVSAVNWIRLGAATHAFDENQRLNHLAFSPVTGGIQITTPANTNLCPPGHYMLFLLNANGVPSVAKIIRIGAPSMPVGLTAVAAPGLRVNLQWADRSQCESGYKIERASDGVHFTPIGVTSANITTYTDSVGLLANSTCTYRVRAWNSYGNSAFSAVASAVALP